MSDHLAAALIAGWICVLWPGVAFAFGIMVGRHGLRHALYLVLSKLSGKVELRQDVQ